MATEIRIDSTDGGHTIYETPGTVESEKRTFSGILSTSFGHVEVPRKDGGIYLVPARNITRVSLREI